MNCFQCGNCEAGKRMYYCPAKNEFVIREVQVEERKRVSKGWKKGSPAYEKRRRDLRATN